MHQGSALSPLLFVIVTEALSREFRVALPWELLYADDLVVIAETKDDLIKRLVSEHGCHHLPSSSNRTLAVPRVHTSLGERSFTIARLRLWNRLTASLIHLTSYQKFKHLKSYQLGL